MDVAVALPALSLLMTAVSWMLYRMHLAAAHREVNRINSQLDRSARRQARTDERLAVIEQMQRSQHREEATRELEELLWVEGSGPPPEHVERALRRR